MIHECPISTPKPEDYTEGTLMSADQLRRWTLAMPEDEQLHLFDDVLQGLQRAGLCIEQDHYRRLESFEVKRAINAQSWETFGKGQQGLLTAWLKVRGLTIETTEVIIEQQDGRIRVHHYEGENRRRVQSFFDGPLPV